VPTVGRKPLDAARQRQTDEKYWCTYSEADSHEVEQWWLVRGDELRDVVAQSLRQTREKIERDNDKRLVGLLVLFWVGLKLLVLSEGGMDNGQTSLIDGLRVFGECSRRGD